MLGALEALKKVKQMPAYVHVDPADDEEKQKIKIRKLIVRSALLKQSDIINFEAQLDGIKQKKLHIIEQRKNQPCANAHPPGSAVQITIQQVEDL